MKATILQEEISEKAAAAMRFVSNKAQLPILGNLLLVTDSGKLKIVATNLETGISTKVGARIEKKGKITVPAKIFTEVILNLPPGKIVLEEKNNKLKISSRLSSIDINTQPAADFPDVPSQITEKSLSLTSKSIRDIVDQVVFSSAINETRPVLTGVFFSFPNSKNTIVVATDGFRLSYKDIGKTQRKTKLKNFLIPATIFKEVERLDGNIDEVVDISISSSDGQVVFQKGDSLLITRTLEGEFPDYNRVIPKDWLLRIEFGREDMLRAVKISSIFVRDSGGVVRFKAEDDKVLVATDNSQFGKHQSEIQVKKEGRNFETAFNYRYLVEALASIRGETVVFESGGTTSPGVFLDKKDPTYKHLIMPIRLQKENP